MQNNTDKYVVNGMLLELNGLFQQVISLQGQIMTKLDMINSNEQTFSTINLPKYNVVNPTFATKFIEKPKPKSIEPKRGFSSLTPYFNTMINGGKIDPQTMMNAVFDILNQPTEEQQVEQEQVEQEQVEQEQVEQEQVEQEQVEQVDEYEDTPPASPPLNNTFVSVNSETDKTVLYDVDYLHGTCTCPHFKYSGPIACKHILTVQKYPGKYGLSSDDAAILKNATHKP
jgi:hypothetical protein